MVVLKTTTSEITESITSSVVSTQITHPKVKQPKTMVPKETNPEILKIRKEIYNSYNFFYYSNIYEVTLNFAGLKILTNIHKSDEYSSLCDVKIGWVFLRY